MILGDIPISAFDPHIFQCGSLYSNLIPSSNFSIPVRVILGWDIPFWSFFLDIYSIVAPCHGVIPLWSAPMSSQRCSWRPRRHPLRISMESFSYGHATSLLRTILEPYSCTVHVLDLLLEYNSMALRCYATVDRYDRYPYMYLGTTEVRYSVDT